MNEDMNEALDQLKEPHQVQTTPLLKDLYQCITPQYAADWKVIGTLLGLPSGELNAIEAGYPTNIKWCCNQMLEKWLEIDPTASWKKLFNVIESPAVSCGVPDKATLLPSQLDQLTVIDRVEEVNVLSQTISAVNIQTRLRVDEDAWPPEQPKTFTPLLLIQHQGQRSLKQFNAMAEFVERGHIDKLFTNTNPVPKDDNLDSYQAVQEVLDTSKVTKEVAEILAPLETGTYPQFVLIEGGPGIGKTMLLKEIAYLWGKQKVLKRFKMVILLCLRDTTVQKISEIHQLLLPFCIGDERATEIASACGKYLLENKGEDLTILFDGYDEYPEQPPKNSLIPHILKRKVLPNCSLILSSQPRAAIHLRKQATVRVDILGFTEGDQKHYVRESMKDQPRKVVELTQYLLGHSTISSLCFVPFNIAVLVYLCKQGIPLPKNSAELYNYFICLTVCRHLAKHGHDLQGSITELTTVPTLTNLPMPYYEIIQQLSKLSLQALDNNKLIFTLDEIKDACSDITAIPGGLKGFGLLQAVEHFVLTGKIVTFNFLHFSIQEFLAAHYIANLSDNEEELRIIQEKFWSDLHFNMFSIYITLTKGQRPSFKHFLCSGNEAVTISDKFLRNQLQCLRLYRCFHEASNVDMCKTIEQSLEFSGNINLSGTTLTASDVECVTVFLTSLSRNKYEWLRLFSCYIQNHGLYILHQGLLRCSNITIDLLGLGLNGLTAQSSSLICDIAMKCKVKELAMRGNDIVGENIKLYSMLSSMFTMLEKLWMGNTKLSTRGAVALFTALKDNKKLKVLGIANNAITDDACNAIIVVLEKNDCLVELYMHCNPLSGKAIVSIIDALKVNNALEVIGIPKCSEDIKKTVSSLQEVIIKNRISRGCQTELSILY